VRAQRRDRRDDVERRRPRAKPIRLLGDDLLGPLRLGAPAVQRLGHDRLEIVDVVEKAAGQARDRGVEVARDCDVDEEERCTPLRGHVVGAGRIGELAALNLVSRGAEIAFVANRTIETARELAHRFGGAAIGLDEVGKTLSEVDVVLSSTSSPDTVVRAGDVPAKRRAPLFFIDIAVPRDLDPEIGSLAGCFLYDIDDLEAVVAETLAGRRAEAQRAEELVAEEAERFRAWHASLDVVPAIASLRAHAEQIRSAELAKVRVSDDERRTLESVTAQILNKLLHLPTVRMKEAAVSADGAVYADAVKHLFGLEGVGSTEPRKSGSGDR
jgi:glutamyl-tRNA reductase